jgi:hypothetical protein
MPAPSLSGEGWGEVLKGLAKVKPFFVFKHFAALKFLPLRD